jgi:hypothetical protein
MEINFEEAGTLWLVWLHRLLRDELWQAEIRRQLAQSELAEIQY